LTMILVRGYEDELSHLEQKRRFSRQYRFLVFIFIA
jgi:hypothetical protein